MLQMPRWVVRGERAIIVRAMKIDMIKSAFDKKKPSSNPPNKHNESAPTAGKGILTSLFRVRTPIY